MSSDVATSAPVVEPSEMGEIVKLDSNSDMVDAFVVSLMRRLVVRFQQGDKSLSKYLKTRGLHAVDADAELLTAEFKPFLLLALREADIVQAAMYAGWKVEKVATHVHVSIPVRAAGCSLIVRGNGEGKPCTNSTEIKKTLIEQAVACSDDELLEISPDIEGSFFVTFTNRDVAIKAAEILRNKKGLSVSLKSVGIAEFTSKPHTAIALAQGPLFLTYEVPVALREQFLSKVKARRPDAGENHKFRATNERNKNDSDKVEESRRPTRQQMKETQMKEPHMKGAHLKEPQSREPHQSRGGRNESGSRDDSKQYYAKGKRTEFEVTFPNTKKTGSEVIPEVNEEADQDFPNL